jgi:hypothetical protein
MDETELDITDDDVIRLPVKITFSPPKARGKTSADVVVYPDDHGDKDAFRGQGLTGLASQSAKRLS